MSHTIHLFVSFKQDLAKKIQREGMEGRGEEILRKKKIKLIYVFCWSSSTPYYIKYSDG